MKAIILLATLKKTGLSNTETLSEFFAEEFKKLGGETEIIKLVNYQILPGTYSDMGEGDEWPGILQKILQAEIIIFSTPIWWSGHSSEMQKVIERLDHLHDQILEGKNSPLEGKAGGIIITGDSDGAQHLIGNIANFYNAVGILLPPFASLSVLSDAQKKGGTATREQLMEQYRKDYTQTAQTMIRQLMKYSPGNS